MSEIIPNVVVSMPSQLFTMARSFKACSNGKIYIGKIDTDPTIPENQIQVYLEREDGLYTPVSQPMIINQAGYPVYAGQIAKFVTIEGHAMAMYDSYGVQQFYFPNVLKYDPDQFEKRFREELASDKGATLVGINNGSTVQDNLNKLHIKKLDKTIFDVFSHYHGSVAYSNEYNSLEEWASDDKDIKVFSSGKYRVDSPLIIRCKELHTDGVVEIETYSDGACIQLGEPEVINLGKTISPYPSGSRNINITTNININKEDFLFAIVDYTPRSYQSSRPYYHKGEFLNIEEINDKRLKLSTGVKYSYITNCDVLAMKKSSLKRVSGDFIFNHNKINRVKASGFGIFIFHSENVEISNLSINSYDSFSSLSLKNCRYVNGKGMKIYQSLKNSLSADNDYGVIVDNSENISLNGVFSGNRHAIAHGGSSSGAPIVNKNCHHSGEFFSLTESQAADFHGNTENCSFSGYIQGVVIGGHKNTICNSILENTEAQKNQPVVYFAEMKTIEHAVYNNTIITQGKPEEHSRAVIDMDGNGSYLNENITEPGTLLCCNNTIISPNSTRVIRIHNNGSKAVMSINISNNNCINSGKDIAIFVSAISGNKFKLANVLGTITLGGSSISVEAEKVIL
ncbi:phage head-binding domain-containing protein [Xenorhabdus szentirmaii]|uniref:phage head-binding domain-containing protein n=1 Tax=Xenorhabdus szentirmaii TaxID=290112 RepID=UPI002B40987B|nr:phage head-binding domain-containing protein [Xenorhabdus sp. CUL]